MAEPSVRAALCCHLASAADLLTPALRTPVGGSKLRPYFSPFVYQSSPDYVSRRGRDRSLQRRFPLRSCCNISIRNGKKIVTFGFSYWLKWQEIRMRRQRHREWDKISVRRQGVKWKGRPPPSRQGRLKERLELSWGVQSRGPPGQQESRAVARKPRDAAAVLFGIKFADKIHYKFQSSRASKARL